MVTIDKIIVSLKERATSYQSVYTIFKVIVDSCNKTTDGLRYNAQVLARNYSDDLSMDTFPGEIVQFVAFAKGRDCTTPADQAKLLCEGDLTDTFPNVHVALRMYLCMMVTCCSGERSFSKLALIRNDLRSTMRHDRLSALCLLSIESELLRNMNFEEVVQEFADAKSCRCT